MGKNSIFCQFPVSPSIMAKAPLSPSSRPIHCVVVIRAKPNHGGGRGLTERKFGQSREGRDRRGREAIFGLMVIRLGHGGIEFLAFGGGGRGNWMDLNLEQKRENGQQKRTLKDFEGICPIIFRNLYL